MAPKTPTLTTKSLQALLTRIGSAISGRKENLISRFSRDLELRRLPRGPNVRGNIRILSIDMGIKNLAYCVADVKVGKPLTSRGSKDKRETATEMDIMEWRRLDVAEEVSRSIKTPKTVSEPAVNEEGLEDPYTPSALSSTAYALLVGTLLPHKPDIILIERQRWRSSGGVAIQQWTVRVNTLEGMLWAILVALRSEYKARSYPDQHSGPQKHAYEIFGVDPKRVGSFWLGESFRAEMSKRVENEEDDELVVGPEGEVEEIVDKKRPAAKKLSRGKAEKKAKIKLLRSWLTPGVQSTKEQPRIEVDGVSPAINLRFRSGAEDTKKALCEIEGPKTRRKKEAINIQKLKKLDDVTDCFLQAAAWVAWEVNRTKMVEEWDSENGRLYDAHANDQGKEEMDRKKGSGAAKTIKPPKEDVPRKPRKRLSGSVSKPGG